ncbi:hypothetical protein [Azotobacter chroococcum]|uniref:Uncharacterized protein n=1 Tax=Azotobacter chroococcum TaxID=353 RepID=A0AAP9YD09_9GAMM|nr:hypothetical protein [Azotobacter chroococcum]QQE88539.1 hypothetical protein GKQ51_20275 [Azotobacter chroococcum]
MADFRPLGFGSQGSLAPVLYLDTSASSAALLDAADRRTGAVRDLLEALGDCKLSDHQPAALSQVARAALLLLDDAADLQNAARLAHAAELGAAVGGIAGKTAGTRRQGGNA